MICYFFVKEEKNLVILLVQVVFALSARPFYYNNSHRISPQHSRGWDSSEIYAVFVRNFTFLGNKTSTVKIKSKLIPVVDNTLIMKVKKVPNCNHSSNVR